MRSLSLELRSGGAIAALSQGATGRAVGVSFLMHGLGISAMVLIPILSSTPPPEPAEASLRPLAAPVRIALPPPPKNPSAPRGAPKAPQAARAVVPSIQVPQSVPSFIPNLDDILDPGVGPTFPGFGPGTRDATRGADGDCVMGALCGDAPLTAAVPNPPKTPRIGGSIKEPRLLEGRAPRYPALAQTAGVEGVVVLEAHVGADGRIKDCRIVEGNRLFDKAALTSVRSRRYQPLLLNGVPSDFIVTVTVAFRIKR